MRAGRKALCLTLGTLLFLAACSGEVQNPESTPTKDILIRSEAYIEESEILLLESFPVQVRLRLRGNLPTPCHELQWEVSEPDELGRINVEVSSTSEPDRICIQVLEPFEAQIPLGDYREGEFTVWLKGEMVGEFNLP
jgi:inhibitor of cysteine peptidase